MFIKWVVAMASSYDNIEKSTTVGYLGVKGAVFINVSLPFPRTEWPYRKVAHFVPSMVNT